MDSDSVQLLLRNLGSLVAGFLITHGAAKSGSEEVIIGVVMGGGMVVYSWWSKRNAARIKAATAAVALALPAGSTEWTLNKALATADTPLPAVDLSQAPSK